MAKLVDASVLGTGGEIRGGSSPLPSTTKNNEPNARALGDLFLCSGEDLKAGGGIQDAAKRSACRRGGVAST